MTTSSPSSPRSIIVLVVRHGEREDEAARRRDDDGLRKIHYRKPSNQQDRVDPKLTQLGYALAAHTWCRIKTALCHAGITDQIAVFSSPLRRSVGTAMMLSVVNSNDYDSIHNATTSQTTPRPPSQPSHLSQVSRSLFSSKTKSEGTETATATETIETKTVTEPSALDEPSNISTTTTRLKFTLPIPEEQKELYLESTSSSSSTVVPIVIHNGLADCTALVCRLGGFKNLVKTGLIHCAAAVKYNNNGSSNTTVNNNQDDEKERNDNNTRNKNHDPVMNNPIMWDELNLLKTTIQQTPVILPRRTNNTRDDDDDDDDDVDGEKKATRIDSDDMKIDTTTTTTNDTVFGDHDLKPVQFWKIGGHGYTPMIPPLPMQTAIIEDVSMDIDSSRNNNNNFERNDVVTKKIHAEPKLQNEPPIDQVVRMALDSNCKVVIVASHREEIRYLTKERCQSRQSFHTPYCTVGLFEVVVDDDDIGTRNNNNDDNHNQYRSDSSNRKPSPPLQWILHDVCAPEDLTPHAISRMKFASHKLSQKHVSDDVVDIEWPVIERTMVSLCKARLIMDDELNKRSIRYVRKCTLNGAKDQTPDDEEDMDGTSNKVHSNSFDLIFHIYQGHHSWLQFLKRLHDCTAFGTMQLEMADGQQKEVNVLLKPNKQPTLPCPPTTICFEIVSS